MFPLPLIESIAQISGFDSRNYHDSFDSVFPNQSNPQIRGINRIENWICADVCKFNRVAIGVRLDSRSSPPNFFRRVASAKIVRRKICRLQPARRTTGAAFILTPNLMARHPPLHTHILHANRMSRWKPLGRFSRAQPTGRFFTLLFPTSGVVPMADHRELKGYLTVITSPDFNCIHSSPLTVLE